MLQWIFKLTSYSLSAIQYLQIQGVVPNLQNSELISALEIQRTLLWQKPSSSVKSTNDSEHSSGSGFSSLEVDILSGARRFDTTFVKVSDAKDEKAFFEAAKGLHTTPVQLQSVPRGPIFEEMGGLFKGFITWLCEFDFDECGISIRLGSPFRRNEKPSKKELLKLPYVAPPNNEWKKDNAIVCQDPFIFDRNTANITKTVRNIIIDECWRARALLEEERERDSSLLSDLLVDYEHEQMIRQHEIAMTSFDKSTQDYIIKEANKKKNVIKQHARKN